MSNDDLVEVTVSGKRWCDFCTELAAYDAKTRMGPWAYMCEEHFKTNAYTQSLGLGKGQKLIFV